MQLIVIFLPNSMPKPLSILGVSALYLYSTSMWVGFWGGGVNEPSFWALPDLFTVVNSQLRCYFWCLILIQIFRGFMQISIVNWRKIVHFKVSSWAINIPTIWGLSWNQKFLFCLGIGYLVLQVHFSGFAFEYGYW